MKLQQPPIVRTEMLIRKPVAEVFRAFTVPAVTTRFWFTGSGGPLEAGRKIRWEWKTYGVSTQVVVRAVEREKRIGGFSFVLAGVKALLEHGNELNLVPDHAPDKHMGG
jgi:hypothetical protein